MESMDVIRNKRAVRDYTNASIERATIERLIEATILAPSAMNLQPWAFSVLLGREHIESASSKIERQTEFRRNV
jgi:nitroreductase